MIFSAMFSVMFSAAVLAQTAVGTADIITSTNDYAIIINTGQNKYYNTEDYWNNCSAIYKLLVNHGYDKKHITVLMSDGNDAGDDMNIGNSVFADSPRDLDGDGANDVNEPATSAID